MQLVSKKNFMFVLATLLVVAFGYMALTTSSKPAQKTPKVEVNQVDQLTKQSDSDDLQTIQKDLDATDFSDLDSELQNIDKELNKTN